MNLSVRLQWLGFLSMVTGYATVRIGQSALGVALPYIQREFGATDFQIHWMINIYLLALASFVLVAGRLGDLYGMRRIFLIGSLIFSLASVACALSQSAPWLIIARAVQGIGGAIVLPLSLGSINYIFSEHHRHRAVALFGMAGGLFIILGLLIGGLFTQFASWRWIFWINPIVGCFTFVMVYYILRGLDEHRDTEGKVDYFGSLLLVLWIVPLIIALMQGQSWGWGSWYIIVLFALVPIFLFAFYFHEKKAEDPLIHFDIFKNTDYTVSYILFLVIQISFVAPIFFALFLEKSLGFKAFLAAVALLPSIIGAPFYSVFSEKIANKYSLKNLLRIGFFVTFLALLWLGIFSHTRDYGWIVVGFVFFGLGMPFCMIMNYTLMTKSITTGDQSASAGVNMASRQLGGVIGIAAMAIAIIYAINHYASVMSYAQAYARGFSIISYIVAIAMAIGFILTGKISK